MKSLIIYSTKYGSVGHAAEMLRAKLTGDVFLVNIITDQVPNLEEFDTIVIGGSIYIGKIQKIISEFIAANMKLLLTKKIGLFICAAESGEKLMSELCGNFSPELFDHAVAKDIFGYEIQLKKMNFAERFLIGKILKKKESVSALSEENIERFAKALMN